MMHVEYIIQVDHFQFYLGDAEVTDVLDYGQLWKEPGPISCISGCLEMVAVRTETGFGSVQVAIEVHERAPEPFRDSWECLGQFQLKVESGRLLITAPETLHHQHIPVEVLPGSYSGTVYGTGMDDVVDIYAANGPEKYVLVLWPETGGAAPLVR